MIYFEVFQTFVDAFFPSGTLSDGVRGVLTQILAVLPILLIVGALSKLFGGSKRFPVFVAVLVCIVIVAEYLLPLIPAFAIQA